MRTTLALVVVACCCSPLLAQAKPEPSIEGIQLRLEVVTPGEGKPQLLRGLLKNGSKEPFEVVISYDGYQTQLQVTTEGLRHPMFLWRRNRIGKELEKIPPGEERVLFEFPLRPLVDNQLEKVIPGCEYGWDWTARPSAPHSPFVARDGAIKTEGTFEAIVRAGRKSVASPPLRLKWEKEFRVVEEKK